MSNFDSSGMSPADFAAMTNNMNANDNNWFIWIVFLWVMSMGGFGGWGNRGPQPQQNSVLDSTLAAAAAQGGFVTQNDLDNVVRLQALQHGQRDLNDSLNQNKYDIVNAGNAAEARLTSTLSSLAANQAANAQAMQNCCSTINYNAAMNTASINENTTAQIQKVLDAVTGNRMADMQNQINQLQLQNAVAGVVRYPMASTYSSGVNPFCGCGCGTTV